VEVGIGKYPNVINNRMTYYCLNAKSEMLSHQFHTTEAQVHEKEVQVGIVLNKVAIEVFSE
jgi:hypothetical protein